MFKLKRFYWASREIQGKLNEIALLMSSTVQRDNSGRIDDKARESMHDVARISRLFHQLYWSVVVKRLAPLHSMVGISYLLSLRQISFEEYESLKKADAASISLFQATMTWLACRIQIATEKGHVSVDPSQISGKITSLLTHTACIQSMYDGRMPIAYAHFVYVLITV